MFAISIPVRPDRCECCRFGHAEKRYVAPPMHSLPSHSYLQGMTDVIVCKRMPPVANADGNGVSPVVQKGDYCGEFDVKGETACQ
jgi:hypothetical protein